MIDPHTTQLESVRGIAERISTNSLVLLGPMTGMSSLIRPSIPARRERLGVAHARESVGGDLWVERELGEIEGRAIRFGPRMAVWRPPISTVPFENCLKDSERLVAPTTGFTKGATGAVIISM